MSRRLGSLSDTLFRGFIFSFFLLFLWISFFWDIGVSASLLAEILVSFYIFYLLFLICLKIIHDTHVFFICFALMHL